MIIYVVHALRHDDDERHSIIIAVTEKKRRAYDLAINYEWYRGGKYGCRVLEMDTKDLSHNKIVREPSDKTKGEHNKEVYNDFD